MPKSPLDPRQLHLAMYGLIYPAVLGSILFGLVDGLAKGQLSGPSPLSLACLAIFGIVFTLDFVYSHREEMRAHYSGREFAVDALIVAMLYLGAGDLLGYHLLPMTAWSYLALAKLFAAIWEFSRIDAVQRRNRRVAPGDALEIEPVARHGYSDLGLGCAYLLLPGLAELLLPSLLAPGLLLLLVLLADARSYIRNLNAG